MGTLTRDELLAQAGLASGNDQTTTFANTWVNAWLKRTAKSWAWPILKARITDLPIAQGAVSVDVGNGDFVTTFIHRIFNPLFIRSTDYKFRGRLLISDLLNGNPDTDESVTQAANRLGTPETCKIRLKINGGAFTIFPNPVPNQAMLISLDVHIIPAALTLGTEVPWYQSDRTLLQAYKCALLEFDDGGEGGRAMNEEMAKLSQMVVDDRDFDGEGHGDNQVMGLDKSVFI
jgi:hypothetical protein